MSNNMSGRLEKEMAFYEKMSVKLKELPKIIGEYFTSMRANRKSYKTIERYIEHVLHFAHFITNNHLSEDFYKHISPSDVERYMISLETRNTSTGVKRTGDAVLQTRWSSLNTFFEWAMNRGYVDKNPIKAVDRPKNNTERKVTYLSKTEINKLLKAVDKNPNEVIAARDRAIISLALATGLRVSALLNINVEDIDFDSGIINVIEKRQKVRAVDIGENVKVVLKDWIKLRNHAFPDINTNALFVSQLKQRWSDYAMREMLERYCDNAGIKRITPHKLRATAACALAKAGVPLKAIQKQLGHSSSQTTLIYIDAFEEDNARAKGILDNLF